MNLAACMQQAGASLAMTWLALAASARTMPGASRLIQISARLRRRRFP